ncbi:YihY/virulence factor BrkB family protein [Corynebacterium doosanense]|nr:YihY/virulence factor BrkB family protein [Corynebacterium doosanense]
MSTKIQTSITMSDRWYVIRRSIASFWQSRGQDSGATLTFFSVLAFAPTLLSVYSIATLILANNRDLVEQLTTDFIQTFVPGGYESVVRDVVNMVVGSSAGGIIGLVVAVFISLWSSSAYVRAFSRTANEAYGVWEGRNIVRLWASMFLVTAMLVVGMVLVLAAAMLNKPIIDTLLVPVATPLGLDGVVQFLTEKFLPVWRWVRWPVIVILLMLIIDVMYYFTPNIRAPRFRLLSVGSTFATAGIIVVGLLFTVYLRYLTGISSYGALGTVIAALFALWIANIIVVFGIILDVESLRMRQLRRGKEAEETLDLPVRSEGGIEFLGRVQERHVGQARDIRGWGLDEK